MAISPIHIKIDIIDRFIFHNSNNTLVLWDAISLGPSFQETYMEDFLTYPDEI